MKKLMILILLVTSLVSTIGKTDSVNWQAYHDIDHFKWTDYNNGVHILTAYAITMTGTMLLTKKFGMNKFLAAGIMTVVGGLVGTTKEVFFDKYTSRTDIKCWWAGAATAGAMSIVINF